MAEDAPDLSRARRIHIVGAGGAGMSAIGAVLLAMGHRVSGSDAVASTALDRLAAAGATVHVGHDPTWLDGAEVVARSTAIPADDPEILEAGHRGLRVWRRAELLSAICRQQRTVAVSGTHGKTTTSSMLAVVLREAGWHPSMIVGGDIAGIGSGAAWDSDGEWLVVEADESDGTFLALGAEAVLVTSVEPDHLDFYGNVGELRRAFSRFVGDAPGAVVLCADDPGAASLVEGPVPVGNPLVTYGTTDRAHIQIIDPKTGRRDASFSLSLGGRLLGPVGLQVPGMHNIRNATGAIAMATTLGVAWPDAIDAVARYSGVARRFEWRGERDGVTFVDDYGHLPTEVAATITAARSGGWNRIVAVFQPHRYSRTESLAGQFADAFIGADVVVVTDVYSAGEAPRPGVTGELIARAIRDGHPDADVRYQPDSARLAVEVAQLLRPGDLCLTLGAGDLTKLPEALMAGNRGMPGHA